MKLSCILLTVLILLAIMLVCVMVKFATDINVEDHKLGNVGSIYHFTQDMGMIPISDESNLTLSLAERFPYMAAITRNSSKLWSFACFASVILVKWVVTSAHCRRYGSTHRVLLYHDYARNLTHTYPILLWRLHEKFNISNPMSKHDIAVAKLNVDFHPFNSMKPAIFDEKQVSDVDASIWKTVSTMDKSLYLTNEFEKFEVTVASSSRCVETYGLEFDESLICIDMSNHEDCFINEFGPIFSQDKVVGILAVKPKDCDNKLAVFTNVSYFTNWILRVTHTTY